MTDVTPHPHRRKARRPSLAHIGVILATWFGAGYLPKAPGTWGSLGALPFAWVLVEIGGLWTLAAAVVAVFCVGVWAAYDYMERTDTDDGVGGHDPGQIVIDEVAGQWLVLLAAPLDPVAYAIGFLLFRLFDVLKPWPISWADRAIGGGWGVMIDDILAGLFGWAALYVMMYYGSPYLLGWL